MLGLNWFALSHQRINFVEVEAHVFILLALFVLEILAGVRQHLEVVILVLDVFEEAVRDLLGDVDREIEHKRAAEVSPGLHQVAGAEVVVFERTSVITAE